MPRLRKKLWPQRGLVNTLLITFWENKFRLKLITNLWSLFSAQNTYVDDLPPRILHFRLCLTQFDYTISHVPGKLLYTADTLSHAPQECLVRDAELADLTEEQMTTTTTNQFPTTTDSLESYQQAHKEDPICTQLTFCQTSKSAKRAEQILDNPTSPHCL